jgi:hypothetical protein
MTTSGSRKPAFSRAPILPDRVRAIGGESFAFIPHRFLRAGFIASLTRDELALYTVLVLAADRNGVSFYHYDSLCSILECTLDSYLAARNGLIEKDLVAYDGTRFQVLSLPNGPKPVSRPLQTAEDFEAHDPATIRQLVLDVLGRDS